MTTTMYATFDGEVFRPEEPIPLEPNTRVRLTIGEELVLKRKMGEPGCFFRAALAMAASADEPVEQPEPIGDTLFGDDIAGVDALLGDCGTMPFRIVRDAVFDGDVLRPEDPIPLEPNARVRVTIEAVRVKTGEPYCSLHAMLAANLDGPPDWSERIHEYLYGEDCRSVD